MISAVVLTRNEEQNIRKCFRGLGWCDELIVIDDYSTDNTWKLTKELGAKVYKRHLNNDFSAQRNFGLSKAKNEWVLFLDGDEVVSKFLKSEILERVFAKGGQEKLKCNGFYIKRRDFWMERELKHGYTGETRLLRLGKKGKGKWKRAVHEYWDIAGPTCELENVIEHYPHPTIGEFVADINRYSEIHASENKRERKKFNFLFVIFHPAGKFFVDYILKLGFLDGTQGFVYAIMMSFHSFLSWSRLWIH